MKLIIGYFTLIVVLLAGLSIFANAHAESEAKAQETAPAAELQQTNGSVQPAVSFVEDVPAYVI
ncbi:MAG TPA: hypothetical protein EYG02_01070 [Henriciella marina]|uniref:hypothetical protein n=1 Tax=Henriciella sp. TaxID=1968823 RepID=UPI001798907C|nr:hypothetical protein [Henriciella sp.]HIG21700.1 hypothetical protein [Henriciella sp.]HIK63603.1 hypothetical protein [Henriciella marina]